MLFEKKVRRLINPEKTDKESRENPLELEKGDMKAIIIAAFVVYGPVVLAFCGIVGLIAWFLLR